MDYLSTLSEPEQQALLAYIQETPPAINLFLRGSITNFYPEDFDNFLHLVDVVYHAPETTKEMIVYRGTSETRLQGNKPLYHQGFISTSLSKEEASYFGPKVLEITIPVGTKALIIGSNKRFFEQEEVLLPPGTLHFISENKYIYVMHDNSEAIKDLIYRYRN